MFTLHFLSFLKKSILHFEILGANHPCFHGNNWEVINKGVLRSVTGSQSQVRQKTGLNYKELFRQFPPTLFLLQMFSWVCFAPPQINCQIGGLFKAFPLLMYCPVSLQIHFNARSLSAKWGGLVIERDASVFEKNADCELMNGLGSM